MTLHASPLATRHRTQHFTLRRALAQLLQALSARLDAMAEHLQSEPSDAAVGTGVIEFSHDPETGHGVLYEDGVRRFTFLQGLERL
jgi:hypothetical protein